MENLLGGLSADTKDERLYILSIRRSLQSYERDPEFDLLRKHIPPEVAVEYAGDADSVYSLLEDVYENDDEEARFANKPKVISDEIRDHLAMELFAWNDRFKAEVDPQVKTFGLSFQRDFIGGQLAPGYRLVVCGPEPHSP